MAIDDINSSSLAQEIPEEEPEEFPSWMHDDTPSRDPLPEEEVPVESATEELLPGSLNDDLSPETDENFISAADSEVETQTADTEPLPLYGHLAFVAGATGVTGREVVGALAQRGIETLAHIRPDSPYASEWIEYFREVGSGVDITHWAQEEMSHQLSEMRPSLVFCLLGSSDQRINGDGTVQSNPFVDSYMAVDYGLVAMLIRACSSAGESNLRFVLASVIGADESSSSDFMRMKAKAEDFLIQSGLDYTIIRIGSIKDSDRGGREKPAPRRLLGFGKKSAPSIPVDVKALAETLVDVALDPEYSGRILETAPEENEEE